MSKCRTQLSKLLAAQKRINLFNGIQDFFLILNNFFRFYSDRLHPVKNQWGKPRWGQVSPLSQTHHRSFQYIVVPVSLQM